MRSTISKVRLRSTISILTILLMSLGSFVVFVSAKQTTVARINHLAWSPSGEYIAAITEFENNQLVIYHTQPVAVHLTKIPENNDHFLSAAWSPEGNELAVGVIEASGFVRVDILKASTNFSLDRSYQDDEIGNSQPIQWQPTGQLLAIENYWFISILDADTMSLDTILEDDFSEVGALKFSPTGQFLASTHTDGEVRIWDVSGTNFGLAQKSQRQGIWERLLGNQIAPIWQLTMIA